MNPMNILYSIDEMSKDYSRYLGVSILSLLEHNKNEDINIYILSEYIEESNKNELIRIVKSYGKKIFFSEGRILPDKFKKILGLNGVQPMATYYRFFFGDKFNIKNRILYLDCDTIINKNLSEFYNTDFEGNAFIGNIDLPLTAYVRKENFGINNYINAGAILINVDILDIDYLYKGMLKVNKDIGKPELNDQDYLNFIYKDKIKVYKKLQHYVYFPRGNIKYGECLITHCMKDPNKGKWSFCPKYLRKIFDKYLLLTKRKDYSGFEAKFDKNNKKEYFIQLIRLLIVYISLNCFGEKYTWGIIKFMNKFRKSLS